MNCFPHTQPQPPPQLDADSVSILVKYISAPVTLYLQNGPKKPVWFDRKRSDMDVRTAQQNPSIYLPRAHPCHTTQIAKGNWRLVTGEGKMPTGDSGLETIKCSKIRVLDLNSCMQFRNLIAPGLGSIRLCMSSDPGQKRAMVENDVQNKVVHILRKACDEVWRKKLKDESRPYEVLNCALLLEAHDAESVTQEAAKLVSRLPGVHDCAFFVELIDYKVRATGGTATPPPPCASPRITIRSQKYRNTCVRVNYDVKDGVLRPQDHIPVSLTSNVCFLCDSEFDPSPSADQRCHCRGASEPEMAHTVEDAVASLLRSEVKEALELLAPNARSRMEQRVDVSVQVRGAHATPALARFIAIGAHASTCPRAQIRHPQDESTGKRHALLEENCDELASKIRRKNIFGLSGAKHQVYVVSSARASIRTTINIETVTADLLQLYGILGNVAMSSNNGMVLSM